MIETQATDLVHNDGMQNTITQLGMVDRDKRMSGQFVAQRLSKKELNEMYLADDLNKKVIDMLPEHMVRRWAELQVPEGRDKKVMKNILMDLKRLKAKAIFQEALEKMRLFGGSGIFLGVNDGNKDLSKPLDLERVKSVDSLTVFDCFELEPVEWQLNPLLPDFRDPSIYNIAPEGVQFTSTVLRRVHSSRLIIFNNKPKTTSNNPTQAGKGWGTSLYVQMLDILRDYKTNIDSVSHTMTDFTQSVYKIQGLAQAYAMGREEVIIKRMALIDQSRSVVRGTLMDAEKEDFQRQTTVMSGIPEIMDRFQVRVAAGAETPVVVLFGNSPNGLNATGKADLTNFYNTIESKQEKYMRSQLEQLVKIVGSAKMGLSKGKVPTEFEIKFLPLDQPTLQESADTRKTMAEADMLYYNMGVLSPRVIAESRGFGSTEYSLQTNMDPATVSEKTMEVVKNEAGSTNKPNSTGSSKVGNIQKTV